VALSRNDMPALLVTRPYDGGQRSCLWQMAAAIS
jgi:hypothetical protein